MKKFIFGLLVGMALMLTGSVFAADIQSLIGKTIQGQFSVTVDGKQLEMPAIVVDGTSFLPVRSFGESVGYAVYFDAEGAIRLEKQAQLTASNDATAKIAQWEKDRAANQKMTEDTNAKIKAEQDAYQARTLQLKEEEAASEALAKKSRELDAQRSEATKAAQ